MLKSSVVLLRRGKPRPRAGLFPDKYRRVPAALKPQQGGQQYFNSFLLRSANDALEAQQQQQQQGPYRGDAPSVVSAGAPEELTGYLHPRLPQSDVEGALNRSRPEIFAAELQALAAQDGFASQRGFNERLWYEQEQARLLEGGTAGATAAKRAHEQGSGDGDAEEAGAPSSAGEPRALPERVLGDDYFQERFGFSLLKGQPHDAAMPTDGVAAYGQLDLWGEMPKYHRDFVFLYLVSRRRNTYAVAYNYDGARLLQTYTAGNRGLKGGDRGFRADGSTDNGHQVTSMYLNDLLPKIRETRAAAGRPMGRGEKVDLVVRVMGFYNGRQGAVRAVQDRSADFCVRYLEDVTPFPLNGPKMPRGVFR